MENTAQARLNFLKLINYPTIYGGQQQAQHWYEPPLQCNGVCVLCERAMFADGSRSEVGGNVPSDYLSKISHAADTADLEATLGPLPLPDGTDYIHARVFLVFEAPNKGEASENSGYGILYAFQDITKHVPVHHHYWTCPKQDHWPEGWPKSEDDILRHGWAGWVIYGGYLAYVINRYHLKDAYITNAIKCGKASGAYNFTRGSRDGRVLLNCTTTFLKEEIRLTPPKVIFPFGDRARQICTRAGLTFVDRLWHPKRRGKTPREIIRHNDSIIEPALRKAGLLSGSLGARDSQPRSDSHLPQPGKETAELATGSNEIETGFPPEGRHEERNGSLVRDFTRALERDLKAALGTECTEWEIYNEFELEQEHPKVNRAFEMWKHTWAHTWPDTGRRHPFRSHHKICIGMVALTRGPNDEPGGFRIGVIKYESRTLYEELGLRLRKSLREEGFGESTTSNVWWIWGQLVDERYRDWGSPDVQARLEQGGEALTYFTDFFLGLKGVVGAAIDRELGVS